MLKSNTRYVLYLFFVAVLTITGFFVAATYKNLKLTQAQYERTFLSQSYSRILDSIHEHADWLEQAHLGFLENSRNGRKQSPESIEQFLSNDLQQLHRLTLTDSFLLPTAEKISADVRHIIAGYQSVRQEAQPDREKSISQHHQAIDQFKGFLRLLQSKNQEIVAQSARYVESLALKTTYRFFIVGALFLVLVFYFLFKLINDFSTGEKTAARLRYQASLINAIPDAIFTTDTTFRVQSWNQYAATLYGFTQEEAIGKIISELFTIHNPGNQAQQLQELQKKGAYADEYQITKKNGESIAVMATVNTVVNSENEITGYVAVHRDITVRKKLEENQLQFSKELERQVSQKTAEVVNLVERITDGFLAMDSDFIFTYVNARAGEMLGHTPDSMIGRSIYTDQLSTKFNEACKRAFQQQEFIFFENYYEPLNRWLENSIYPSPDGLSVFFKDITSRKKTELALQESEERYRHLIDHINAGVVVHLPDSSIVLHNQEAARILGIEEKQLTGKTAFDTDWFLVDEKGNRLGVEEYPVIKVIKTGLPIHNTVLGVQSAQQPDRNWVLVNAYPEWNLQGELLEVVVTFVDITPRILTESELKRSEENLNRAQQMAKIGSWEFNLQSRELKWSSELYRIFELEGTPDQALYTSYQNKFHPEDLPKLDEMIRHSLETKTGKSYQHRSINHDGSIKHILCIGDVILNQQGEPVILKGTAQDITEMVKAEEKLQQSYRQIQELVAHLQNIREQERTRIAREIHDELGQQLTGLKMYLSWISKKSQPAIVEVQEKFEAANILIEETIRSVRRISMELRPSILDDLGLIAALEWQCNEFAKRTGISAEFSNHTGITKIPTELKTGLFRIYQESLTNVARHADASQVTASLELEGEELKLTIRDNGKGFAVSHIGTNKTLGLFGMQERAQEMGGHYEVSSSPGMGTTVRVTVRFTSPIEQQSAEYDQNTNRG